MSQTYKTLFHALAPVLNSSKRRSPTAFPTAKGGHKWLGAPANSTFVLHALIKEVCVEGLNVYYGWYWSAKLPKKENKDNQYLHGAHGCDTRQRLRCYRKCGFHTMPLNYYSCELWGVGLPRCMHTWEWLSREDCQVLYMQVPYNQLHILIAKFILYTLYKTGLTEWYPSYQADRKIHHVRHVIIIHILQYRSPDCRKIKKCQCTSL